MVEALFIDGPFDRTRKVLNEATDDVRFAELGGVVHASWDPQPIPSREVREVTYRRVYGPPTPSGTVLYVYDPRAANPRLIGVPR